MRMILAFFLLVQCASAAGLRWEGTTKRIVPGFGEKAVKAAFVFRNPGNEVVRIAHIRGACVCCTSAYATRKKIGPGESGEVVVRVDFGKQPLPVAKVVTVTTDDGQAVPLIVEVHAKR